MTGRQHELRTEQAVLDALYGRLDALRAATRERLGAVRRGGPSGSPQNRSERDAFAALYEDRLAQLEAVEDRLCFGRLDLDDSSTHYIGRIGLTDDHHVSILTDWRAPAAQAFYRATAAHREGVRRRRHLLTRSREVTAYEDEVLDLDDAGMETSGLSGEGALLAALAAGRTGRMGDIVATIQAEQDAIIRAPLTGALVVQGGPGTGKTAVALHRAAYLLYAHRRVLERSGVLLVGPSRTFLRYIDQVLPALGETGVVSTTVGEILPGVRATAQDEPAVAELKGRAVMARIVQRAVRARQRLPRQDVEVSLDGHPLTITRADLQEAMGRARRSGRPHNEARVGFVRDMLGRLAAQYSAQLASPIPADERGELLEEIRSHREVRIALNLAWMPLTPQRLIEDLYVKPHRLVEAAPELDEDARALLARPAGSPWTESDVPLLDEAAELLGEDDQAARAQQAAEAERRAAEVSYAQEVLSSTGAGALVSAELLADRFAGGGPRLTTAERAAADRTWTYGHIVVDEAQELSAMAWRMLLRRCPTRSLTIVGDVAQTSSSAGARSWATMLDPVLRGSWRLTELTVNYRTPASIARLAQRLAGHAGLPLSPLTSARDVPDAVRLRRLTPADDLVHAVIAETEAAAARVVDETGAGRVAVIAAPSLAREVAARLPEALVAGPEAPVSVLDPRGSKGLEFDVVVLAEPAALWAEDGRASDLYVAMTRPTRELVVVHREELPGGLDAAPDGDASG